MRNDVMAFGRVGVDLYPLDIGVGLEDVSTFGKFLGGSPANVAVASARHGRRPALVSRVGDDPFGRFVRRELARLGVDTEFVTVDHHLPTPITFCEIFPPDDFPIYFYRQPKAPDLNISADDAVLDAVRDARLLWLSATGFSQEPSRSAHRAALAARGRRGHVVVDLDYRPSFWPDPSDAREQVAAALEGATVAVGNLEECEVAVGEREPDRAAEALLDRGVDLAIVKQGPRGVLAKTRTETVEVAPHPIDVLNGLGAGDAFGGALCHGLIEGWELGRVIRYANAAGAIVASRLECATAMPSPDDIDALLLASRR